MPHPPRIHRIPRRALAQSPGRVEGAGLVNEDLDFPFAACFDDPFVCFGLGALLPATVLLVYVCYFLLEGWGWGFEGENEGVLKRGVNRCLAGCLRWL